MGAHPTCLRHGLHAHAHPWAAVRGAPVRNTFVQLLTAGRLCMCAHMHVCPRVRCRITDASGAYDGQVGNAAPAVDVGPGSNITFVLDGPTTDLMTAALWMPYLNDTNNTPVVSVTGNTGNGSQAFVVLLYLKPSLDQSSYYGEAGIFRYAVNNVVAISVGCLACGMTTAAMSALGTQAV